MGGKVGRVEIPSVWLKWTSRKMMNRVKNGSERPFDAHGMKCVANERWRWETDAGDGKIVWRTGS
jgi:hypothetical protein